MHCAQCNHDNRPGTGFCTECGTELAALCPACGNASEPDAKFCGACGAPLAAEVPPRPRPAVPAHLAEKIRDARGEVEGEHRIVTILFVDTVSSVAASEGLDLETLHEAVQKRTQLMADAVHAYEGTVLQFLGDGIMAVFGAPIAHEDGARRAIDAALTMRTDLTAHAERQRAAGGPAFEYRIGLNTGPVIVGAIGDDLSMEYTALGDTVNLAARMEQAAQPGTIYVTADTHRQAAGYFEFRELGGLTVKGKPDPIPAAEVVRELATRTRFDVARQRGLTPLVGRDTELATLRNYFVEAQGGAGQVVSLVGEAGIGKSRLVMEFRQTLREEEHSWLQGQCITYGRSIPYMPVTDLLRSGFGIEEGDDPQQIIDKVTQGTAEWEAETRALAPYLRFLLAVDPGDPRVAAMEALERRAGILEALRASVVESSRQTPLVLAIEDLHWIDARSEEAVHSLVDAVGSLPVLLLLTYRPGYETAIPERGYVSRIGLRTLSGDGTAAVARGLLDAPELPAELCDHLAAKAGGNPFYIEEVARHLVENGVLEPSNGSYRLVRPLAAEDIPGTIQDVIRARMDRLDSHQRETLQVASVVGREFTVRLLERLTARTDQVSEEVRALQNVELILEKSRFPEMAYMFKHALTCDVAYESLLADRRRALHRIIAAAIEELYADRIAEHTGTLAHHWYEGQEWPKAFHYLQEAGAQAAQRYANREAIGCYDRALEVCEHLDEAAPTAPRHILARKGHIHLTLSDWPGAVASFTRACALAREADDVAGECNLASYLTFAQCMNNEAGEGKRTLDRARALAEELQDESLRLQTEFLRIWWECSNEGPSAGVVEQWSELAGLVRAAGVPQLIGRVSLQWGFTLSWEGRYADAMEQLPKPADTISLDSLAQQFTIGLTLAGSGRYAGAIARLRDCVARGRRVGEVANGSRAWNTLGWIYGDLGDWRQARDCNEAALALAEDTANDEIVNNAKINLADCAAARGDLAEAKRILETLYDNMPQFQPNARWRYAQHCVHTLGEVLLALGEPDRALALANECLAEAERTVSRRNIVKARRLRGQVFAGQGKPADAETEYRAGLEVAREIGNPPQLWRTLDVLGQALAEQGDAAEAGAAWTEAFAVIEQTAADLDDDELRQTFLAGAEVEAIRGHAGA